MQNFIKALKLAILFFPLFVFSITQGSQAQDSDREKIYGQCKEWDNVLIVAAILKDHDMVNLLLHGHPKDSVLNTHRVHEAMWHAIDQESIDMVQAFVNWGVLPDHTCARYPFIHHAAAKNNSKLMTLFLAQKLYVEHKDRNGHTPLHIAASLGNDQTVQALLSHGADPRAVNNHKFKPSDITSLRYQATCALLQSRLQEIAATGENL